MAAERIEFANALRGIAALSVLVTHYCGVFWLARSVAADVANTTIPSVSAVPVPAIAVWLFHVPVSWGAFGVALFFLISGFVIPFSFNRSSVLGFLIGRVLRIYPLYMAGFTVTLIALTLSGMAAGRSFPYPVDAVLLHYLPGFHDLIGGPSIDGIIWTLEIELKFYVVCAVLAPLLRRGNLWVFATPIALLAIIYAWHGQIAGTVPKTLAMDAEYMLFMFVGVAFNYYFRRAIALPLLTILSAAILGCFWIGMSISQEYPIMTRSFFVAFVLFAACASVAKWWPKSKSLSFFADISYPLYVVHPVLGYATLAFLTNHGAPPLVSMGVAASLAIGVATGLHRWVEMPCHKGGQRLARRLTVASTFTEPAVSAPVARG